MLEQSPLILLDLILSGLSILAPGLAALATRKSLAPRPPIKASALKWHSILGYLGRDVIINL